MSSAYCGSGHPQRKIPSLKGKNLLPLQDAFRTIDWRRMKEKLEELRLVLGIQLAPVANTV